MVNLYTALACLETLSLCPAEDGFLVAMHEVLRVRLVSIERGQFASLSLAHFEGYLRFVQFGSIYIHADVYMRAENDECIRRVGNVSI